MWNIQGPSHLALAYGCVLIGGLSRPNCFLISTQWSAKQTCLISKFLSLLPTFGTISQNFSPLSAKIENGFKIATLRPPIKIEVREPSIVISGRMKMWRIFAFSDVMMQFEILWARRLAPITCHFSHFVSAIPL